MASKLQEVLREAYFIGYKDEKEESRKLDVEALLEMQNASYRLTSSKVGGVLEILPNQKP